MPSVRHSDAQSAPNLEERLGESNDSELGMTQHTVLHEKLPDLLTPVNWHDLSHSFTLDTFLFDSLYLLMILITITRWIPDRSKIRDRIRNRLLRRQATSTRNHCNRSNATI